MATVLGPATGDVIISPTAGVDYFCLYFALDSKEEQKKMKGKVFPSRARRRVSRLLDRNDSISHFSDILDIIFRR